MIGYCLTRPDVRVRQFMRRGAPARRVPGSVREGIVGVMMMKRFGTHPQIDPTVFALVALTRIAGRPHPHASGRIAPAEKAINVSSCAMQDHLIF